MIDDNDQLNVVDVKDDIESLRAKVWLALDPQPTQNKVIVLLWSHSTLTDTANYKLRVSWIEKGQPEVL